MVAPLSDHHGGSSGASTGDARPVLGHVLVPPGELAGRHN